MIKSKKFRINISIYLHIQEKVFKRKIRLEFTDKKISINDFFKSAREQLCDSFTIDEENSFLVKTKESKRVAIITKKECKVYTEDISFKELQFKGIKTLQFIDIGICSREEYENGL